MYLLDVFLKNDNAILLTTERGYPNYVLVLVEYKIRIHKLAGHLCAVSISLSVFEHYFISCLRLSVSERSWRKRTGRYKQP